jgi:hypothetical protein
MACESSTIELEQEFSRLPFQPYRPVQQQKLDILWKVNRVRKDVGLESVDPDCLRVRRRIVRPFGPLDIENAA